MKDGPERPRGATDALGLLGFLSPVRGSKDGREGLGIRLGALASGYALALPRAFPTAAYWGCDEGVIAVRRWGIIPVAGLFVRVVLFRDDFGFTLSGTSSTPASGFVREPNAVSK